MNVDQSWQHPAPGQVDHRRIRAEAVHGRPRLVGGAYRGHATASQDHHRAHGHPPVRRIQQGAAAENQRRGHQRLRRCIQLPMVVVPLIPIVVLPFVALGQRWDRTEGGCSAKCGGRG